MWIYATQDYKLQIMDICEPMKEIIQDFFVVSCTKLSVPCILSDIFFLVLL